MAEVAREARALVYGAAGCPEWGTKFAEIEDDAKEVGHELIRLLMEQTADVQAEQVPESALEGDSGERALLIGSEPRALVSESGAVSWAEPKAYLPKSRKAFFPSEPGVGSGGG